MLVLLCAGALAATAVPALAATVVVSVVDNAFQPKAATAKQGDTVEWQWNGGSTHTVTESNGMDLFDSGPRGKGATFSFVFNAAGSYPYLCTFHRQIMSGRVVVPIKVMPKRGGQGTTFTVTFSEIDAPAGFVFDAQIKRPGAQFVAWQTGVTARTATFVPDAGTGGYQFRSRLRKTSDGSASNYSPARKISVR